MSDTAMIFFLATGVFLLIGVILYQQYAFRTGTQRKLLEMGQKLEEILNEDSEERIMVFMDDPALRELASQINRMLESRRRLKVNFRRSEVSSRKMLSNISHDIKTPMTVILGYLEMLRLGSLSESGIAYTDVSGKKDTSRSISSGEKRTLCTKGIREKDFLSWDSSFERDMLLKVEQKAQEVMTLINRFFSLAKLEAGDDAMEISRIDICEVCRENILDFYGLLTQKAFQVEIAVPEGPVHVWGNRDALQRILSNLISNAIRYGADGNYMGLWLRMDEKYVYIDVADQGKGIDPALAPHVFDRLFTLEDSRNRAIQGSGLGLTIARNLARRLGGEILLDSEPFVKTVFTVKLRRDV